MMVEKEEQQSVYPLAPATNYARSDEEEAPAVTDDAAELRRKKRIKYLIYFVAFVVFQTGIILLFALTVMKIRTPKFRVRSATFETFDVVTTANPSFNIRMNAEFGVKNTNFGHYKYRNSSIEFYYKGTKVSEGFVPRARAKARSTKKFKVVVNLVSTNITNNLELRNDLNSGVLQLSSGSRLSGKVELMKVMKKKKSTNMNCTMEINIQRRELQNIRCK